MAFGRYTVQHWKREIVHKENRDGIVNLANENT